MRSAVVAAVDVVQLAMHAKAKLEVGVGKEVEEEPGVTKKSNNDHQVTERPVVNIEAERGVGVGTEAVKGSGSNKK